jgi:hypothetical protein
MTKKTIEVEGLPEGWKAVAYKKPIPGEYFIGYAGSVCFCNHLEYGPRLIVEKIKPRQIVLEETDEEAYSTSSGTLVRIGNKWWKQVKENDLSLNSDEPKLSLSVDECKRVVNCSAPDVVSRILDFIKENS